MKSSSEGGRTLPPSSFFPAFFLGTFGFGRLSKSSKALSSSWSSSASSEVILSKWSGGLRVTWLTCYPYLRRQAPSRQVGRLVLSWVPALPRHFCYVGPCRPPCTQNYIRPGCEISSSYTRGGAPFLALPRLSGEEDGQGDSHAESQAGGQGRSLHRWAPAVKQHVFRQFSSKTNSMQACSGTIQKLRTWTCCYKTSAWLGLIGWGGRLAWHCLTFA